MTPLSFIWYVVFFLADNPMILVTQLVFSGIVVVEVVAEEIISC